MTMSARKVAVVMPCYCAAGHLDVTLARLASALDAIGPHQIVLVDDGSSDGTWSAVARARERYGPRITGVRLASNQGQHRALLIGMSFLAPDVAYVVTMDDDLQHPPESICNLVARLDADTDLVIAAYGPKQQPAWRSVGARFVDDALRRIYRAPKSFQFTSFRAFKRHVADHAAGLQASHPYVTAALLSATSRRANVVVRHAARISGRSGYSFFKSVRLAANLYFTYSKYPFYLILALAAFTFVLTTALGAWVVVSALLGYAAVPGWASLMAIVSLGNSIVLACLCVFGVYISRFYRERAGFDGKHMVSATL
jgi:glycosyltransferase involved in cell wall biosynthesis